MRLSVITVTCRREARLEKMARTLSAAARFCAGVDFEWMVVDEKLWAHDQNCDLLARRNQLAADGIVVMHLPPKPSRWRGPWRQTERDLPDPNGARNTGLAFCTGDYAVFLDDNCLVTKHWLEGVFEIARKGRGYRAFVVHVIEKLAPTVPPDGVIPESRDIGAPFPVIATQCSGIFGAPIRAFRKIRGMDESYAGEMKWEDLDAIVRLDRIGVPFYSAGRGSVIHVQHERGEVCDDERLYTGTENAARWQSVLADKERFWPALRQPTLGELRIDLAPFPTDVDKPKNGSAGGNGTSGGGSFPFYPPGGGGARAGGRDLVSVDAAHHGLSSELAWR